MLAVISLIADGTVSSEQLSLAELVEAYDVSSLDLTRFKEGRNKTYTQHLLRYVETFCAVLSACESPTADSNLRYQYLENTDSNHTLRDYCTHIVNALTVHVEPDGGSLGEYQGAIFR